MDQEAPDWERLHHRDISPDQWQRFEGYMSEIFGAMGVDLGRPGTERTPRRFLRALFDATGGYESDPKLITAFPTECHGGPDCRISQVVEDPIPFFSLCEHHSLPFFGHAHFGYIAHEHIIGIQADPPRAPLRPPLHGPGTARSRDRRGRPGDPASTRGGCIPRGGAPVHSGAGVREVESRTRTTFWRGTYDPEPELRAGFQRICGMTGA